jgi:hypothetical protein
MPNSSQNPYVKERESNGVAALAKKKKPENLDQKMTKTSSEQFRQTCWWNHVDHDPF